MSTPASTTAGHGTMRLTVIGSGTVVPDPERTCASFYLEAGPARILLDCGPGATHHMARFGVPWASLTHVAVTHFHTDHIGDLPFLFFALKHGLAQPRTEPLTLLGPAGTMERMRALADAFGSYVLSPGVRLNTRELGSGHEAELAPGVLLRAHKTRHTDESLAYRVEAHAAAVAYTGDTGPDDDLAGWLAGADLLVTECSLPDTLGFAEHMTPSGVAALARTARPRRLLLTHMYPQLDRRAVPALVRAAGWEGEVLTAEDGLQVRVPSTGSSS